MPRSINGKAPPAIDGKDRSRLLANKRLRDHSRPKPGPATGLGNNVEVRARKLGEIVAYSIKRDIAQIGWPVGHMFGSEEDLIQRYGVSRSTLREAVRQVERHGIARMRRGVNGGLIVLQPAQDSAAAALATYLELAAVSLHELFEARELLEGLMLRIVCDNITDVDAARLKAILEELLTSSIGPMDFEVARQMALRDALLAAARNPALSLMLESIYRVIVDALVLPEGDPRLPDLVRASRRNKQALVEAVIAGDEVQARMVLRSTIEQARAAVSKTLAGRGQSFEHATALDLTVDRPHFSDGTGPKLGHRISLIIARDLVAAQPGTRIGAEDQLCERYGVSRAVFREAVRTLELHALVYMRRGFGGGLTCGEPDPAYTVELTSIYLQYSRLKMRHIYEIWHTLQIASAQLAAARIDDLGRSQLANILEAQARACPEERPMLHGRLHHVISTLSGNRVLALFMQTMLEVTRHHPGEDPPQRVWNTFFRSQRQLVAAIGGGDEALSRRLMLRHLKLVDAWYGSTARRDWLDSMGLEQDAAAATDKSSRPTRAD